MMSNLNASDLAALLAASRAASGSASSSSNSAPPPAPSSPTLTSATTSLLLASRAANASALNANALEALASLANAHHAQASSSPTLSSTRAPQASQAQPAPAPSSSTNHQQQTNALISLLIAQKQQQQQQQREEQEQQQNQAAAAHIIIRQLTALANPPAPLPQDHQHSVENSYTRDPCSLELKLALLLQQKAHQDRVKPATVQAPPSPSPQAQAPQAAPLSVLSLLSSASTALLGGASHQPSQQGQLDAVTIAKILQAQAPASSVAPIAQQPPSVVSAASSSSPSLQAIPSSTAGVGVTGLPPAASLLAIPAARSAATTTTTTTVRKGRTGTFPQKLHQMLSDLERQGQTDIASFLPHGRSFCIHKPREFCAKIMGRYFRMSRFSSFQRQLNLYDFIRITDAGSPDKGSYHHELFVQGRPILSTMMKRNKIKGVKNNHNQNGNGANANNNKSAAANKNKTTQKTSPQDDGSHSAF